MVRLEIENCPRCGKRNMTFWEYLTLDCCWECREHIDFERFGIDMINQKFNLMEVNKYGK